MRRFWVMFLLIAFVCILSANVFAENKETIFPKIQVIFSEAENMHKLVSIPGYEVLIWDYDASKWVKGKEKGDIEVGFVITDQRSFIDFYILSAGVGAHSSNTIVIAPKAKKIFCFSSGTPVTYFNYDAYGENKIFEVVSEFNDFTPSYVQGTQYIMKWQWQNDTFKFISKEKVK